MSEGPSPYSQIPSLNIRSTILYEKNVFSYGPALYLESKKIIKTHNRGPRFIIYGQPFFYFRDISLYLSFFYCIE